MSSSRTDSRASSQKSAQAAPIEQRPAILIEGARTHNLKNITCRIPHRSISVITGPSGSGKSSLAFDTLYAEGQRRFIESMSSYVRQFLERIEKPDVDDIRFILPAVALEQKNRIRNARSTVGTVTEVYDYLRLLFANLGMMVCPTCDLTIEPYDTLRMRDTLAKWPVGTKAILTVQLPAVVEQLAPLMALGFTRFWLNNTLIECADPANPVAWLTQKLSQEASTDVYLVVDRVILRGDKADKRILESLEKAVELGLGKQPIVVFTMDGAIPPQWFYQHAVCPSCQRSFPEPTPPMFSFNSPIGACTSCEGFGKIIGLDLGKVIPNRQLSLQEGAVHPFTLPSNQEVYDALVVEAKKRKLPLNVPFNELTEAQQALVLNGIGQYEGVYGFFRWLESKTYKVHVRVMLAKYRGYYPCPDCHGSRLKPEALTVRISDKTILDVCHMPIDEAEQWLNEIQLSEHQARIAQRLVQATHTRFKTLKQLGLGYLTLDRQSRTLSGGESQRVHLASSLGAALTDTLYVLDEPTVGLHPKDTERLLATLKDLKTLGNTVVMVEHDPDMMLGADWILDIGPCGGHEGGYLVYQGDVKGLLETSYSPTAQALTQRQSTPKSTSKTSTKAKIASVVVRGATGHNLKNIDVAFPTQQLVVVTGVSGSGKSSLIEQTLYATLQQQKGQELLMESLPCQSIEGIDVFDDIVLVDQSPPGRSQRSNPVTYIKAYDDIRQAFAQTRQAQALGITASQFSFNSPGGRCETCEGLGTITVDMQFLADVVTICPDCEGKRFLPSVLAIEIEGKTIVDVLNMTILEAIEFFNAMPRIQKKLKPLMDIGLSYLKLGQTTSTLSGGEAQRLKLASYLASSGKGPKKPTLFLFDEPTTGLHLLDIASLVAVFRQLLKAGHSLIVVEHNLDFIAQADWVIDLGPEGGDGGGMVVAEGTIEDIMAVPASHTGRYLREWLTPSMA